MAKENKTIDHRERIINNVFRNHFIGCMVGDKSIVTQKLSDIELCADVEQIESETDDCVTTMTLDYGSSKFEFTLYWEKRIKDGAKVATYVLKNIS